MKKLIIFASGNGSNAERIITYFKEYKLAEVSLILTNNPQAGVISRAKRLGVLCRIFDKKDLYESNYLLELLKREQPDLIILAGFLWKFPTNLIENFPHKIVNIHPSLLPKYGGKGMYGMNVHRAVIEAKETESGCTIHFVDTGVDTGEIILQIKVPVLTDDTPEVLQKRVLEKEHVLLIEGIKKLLEK